MKNEIKHKFLTKNAGILYAYFCYSATQIITFIFTPLGMLLHYCFGGDGDSWRERKDRSLKVAFDVAANRTPIMTWMCLTITLIIFWAKILERFVFLENHNGFSVSGGCNSCKAACCTAAYNNDISHFFLFYQFCS